MTVVQLRSGDLLLHSPIAFDTTLAKQLQSMGAIRHLVSPNQFHTPTAASGRARFPTPSPGVRPPPAARPRARERRRIHKGSRSGGTGGMGR